ncbi:MAG TPA: mechanosensitive ion channel [Burkholderiaceae bacterium]|nr:mechanosensitive ion channel [Burkholderiaceae bacterium]HMX11708.1 mechanosensitive ion channel [Burkholderiaceae bacterium]HMY98488.1 mechanosensitive ion channel [Burkholderiaceae bacterium]HNB45187.1 mechanosensitive ion channel [Burkholderiaceae bacterium]HNG78091.1 mechanosensitive ion channel [Burkholderiaceae bacterium]
MPVFVSPAQVLDAFLRPSVLLEFALLAAVLGLAALVVRLLSGRRGDAAAVEGSIWFGEHLVDGVLFPLLALALAYLCKRVLVASGSPVAVFAVAVPVLISLALIRLSVRVLSAAFPSSSVMRLVERSISWLAWGAVVLWLSGVLPVLLDGLDDIRWKIGAHPISLRTLLEGTLSAGFLLMLALWVSAALEARLLRGATGEQLSLRKAAANVLRAGLLFIGLLVSLSAVGIDLTALSVLGGALGVGIGFGLQKLAANYVSGFVILAERSVRIGDIVRVAEHEGRITDITTRYTVIRAQTGREAIVPNEMLITGIVENLTLADPKLLLTTQVGVGYDTDVEALRPKIDAVLRAVDRVLPDPAPNTLLSGFGASGLDLTVCFWIGDPANGQGNVRSAVNLALLDLLRREGVDIPYPQQVVHQAPEPAASPRS